MGATMMLCEPPSSMYKAVVGVIQRWRPELRSRFVRQFVVRNKGIWLLTNQQNGMWRTTISRSQAIPKLLVMAPENLQKILPRN